MEQDKGNLDSYMHRMIVWRRKKRMSIIMLVIFLAILVFLVQFYMVDQKGRLGGDINTKEDEAFMENIAVKFIEAAKLNGQMHKGKFKVHKDNQPRMNELSKQTEKPSEETDQQLGIPYVLTDRYIPNHRIVHFDFKGAPPTIKYLKKIIALAKNVGATGLLLEYEDMFPYVGKLAFMAAKNCYTMEQVRDILDYAKSLNLEVIPLIQTFGHMEFALKQKDFAHLREVPDSPQALCPSRNGSLQFVKELVKQILDAHPMSNYLHIGCDEVFEMGECEVCRMEIRENLFLKHVKNVAKIVHDNKADVQVIIWDDMLRHVSQQTLQESKIGEHVEPMVWVYAEEIYRFVQPPVWDKYAGVFKTAWTASAFKGAFGETVYAPNARRHLENNLRWLDVMSTQSNSFQHGFRGIVLTGWQRYDHFAVLCELLPASLPSLILNLQAVSNGFFNSSLKETFMSTLTCVFSRERRSSPFISLENDPFMWEKLSRCLFPGNGFFKLLYRLHNLEQEAKEYIDTTTKQRGWMTPYNAKHNYSSPLRVEELTQSLPRVYHGMISLARNAADSLADLMDNYTISEWIEQRVYPYILEVEKIYNESSVLKSVKYWPVRPLPMLKDLKRHGIHLG
ncbi:hexosaminidase D-like isoform X2 [Anthonomus grandis grandis]|uniref:hexosaminidase D-like isoform X2 n=1 Tax=Anthonomus grandis grandis TaxID=2921223 RepID=UPI002164F5B1|nr:hexosaminidase D-like isoform X2 [Anthonomus grandis grandis]